MTATDRRALGALGLIGALALALLGWGLGAVDPAPDRPAPPPARPASPPPRPAPARGGARVSLPRPEAPPAAPAPRLDGARKYALNDAVDGVVRDARGDCLAPWVRGAPDRGEVEFVLDVVAVDGEVVDFGLRAPGGEALPPDVVQCLGDVVWGRDWARFEGLSGETRLQRSFTVRPEAP